MIQISSMTHGSQLKANKTLREEMKRKLFNHSRIWLELIILMMLISILTTSYYDPKNVAPFLDAILEGVIYPDNNVQF